jgi:hypothetical protein
VNQTSNPAALDKLKLRIQALRSKTIANGCTELSPNFGDGGAGQAAAVMG